VVEVRRSTGADPDAVWAVLSDGWRLAAWVVGAARVDAVDDGFPAVGAALRYGIGGWPVVLPGSATVTACRSGRELALHGRTPFGGIDMRLLVAPTPSGCVLVMAEDVVSGPARLVPARVRAAAIGVRNVETLRRLALLAEAPAS
jgi:Polyketide cyclase / dehydrase and lipid transport